MSEAVNRPPQPDQEDFDMAALFGDDNDVPLDLGSVATDPFVAPPGVAAAADAPQSWPPPEEPPLAPLPPAAPPAAAPSAASLPSDNLFGPEFTPKTEAQILAEKPPVFSYGGVSEAIADASITFEELRVAKAEDFPELSEGKKVSWSVEYGKSTRYITDPKANTIAKIKEEIEASKQFLDALKKNKDKALECLVKPRVTAQSKGLASYKGFFSTVEEARASDKAICIIPAKNGKLYELRKTELGEFITPTGQVKEFSELRAGFDPALPLIPFSLLQQIISFFRCYMRKTYEYEVLAHIYWDKEQEDFIAHIPRQSVGKTSIDADLSDDAFAEDRYLHYADIHSHNSMPAKFSLVDDRDEQANRVYIVVGRLDKFLPDISVRVANGGRHLPIDPYLVLESAGQEFPSRWLGQVQIKPQHHPGFQAVSEL